MAKSRSRVYHRAKGQVRRDALLHSRSRWLCYRSWAKQAGLRLRLNDMTHESGLKRCALGAPARWSANAMSSRAQEMQKLALAASFSNAASGATEITTPPAS